MLKFGQIAVPLVMAFSLLPNPSAGNAAAMAWEQYVLLQDRLGPIAIGMTLDDIKRNSIEHYELDVDEGETPESSSCYYVYPGGTSEIVSFMMAHGRLVRIDVNDARVRTLKGSSVGSSAAEVLTAYEADIMNVEKHFFAGSNGRYITIPSQDGKTGLLFELVDDVVQSVRAGHIQTIEYVEGCL
jgi:hypothetical protein